MKDLDENMIDLRAYHENLGESLVNKNKDYEEWLSHGMDSILRLIADKFTEHGKLNRPFKVDYKKRLYPSMKELIASINKEDWTVALKAYSTNTQKCNGCDIDKEVIDRSK